MASRRGAVIEQAQRSQRHAVHVAHRIEQAGDAIVDQLRHSADAGGDGGNLAGHGFKSSQAEGLQLAGHQQHIGQRQQLVDALLLAQEVNLP